MYEEMKNINWLSLFIKVVIFLVFVLLIIWLFVKISNKNTEEDFEKNINILKTASIEYFKNGNLPKEEGENKKVTLEELIKEKYIDNFDKSCNQKNSYSQATLVDDYYALRIELECKDKKDYIYTSIDSEGNCVGESCDNNKEENKDKEEEKEESKEESSSSDNKEETNNDNNNESSNGKQLYYEHVKVNKVYSNWQYNKISGSNVETKKVSTKLNTYCQLITSDYYVVGYVNSNITLGKRYRFTLRLNNVPSSTTYFKFVTKEFFNNNSSMYTTYLNSPVKTTFKLGGNAYGMTSNANTIKNSSLKSNNMTFIRAYDYDDGDYVSVDVWVQINNTSGVTKFNNLYFVPIHLKVQYKDNASCVKDTEENASKYKKYTVTSSENVYTTLYRTYSYQKDNNDIKWSTSKSLSGYEFTGKTEWR